MPEHASPRAGMPPEHEGARRSGAHASAVMASRLFRADPVSRAVRRDRDVLTSHVGCVLYRYRTAVDIETKAPLGAAGPPGGATPRRAGRDRALRPQAHTRRVRSGRGRGPGARRGGDDCGGDTDSVTVCPVTEYTV
eukprot:2217598-Prymnesium_polylepis.1